MKTGTKKSFILLLAICMVAVMFPLTALAKSDNFKFATATSLDGRPYPAYDYTIKVAAGTKKITVIPTTMSTNVKFIRINGKQVDYRSRTTVAVSDGTVITIKVVAPDKVTTSTYTLTVEVE